VCVCVCIESRGGERGAAWVTGNEGSERPGPMPRRPRFAPSCCLPPSCANFHFYLWLLTKSKNFCSFISKKSRKKFLKLEMRTEFDDLNLIASPIIFEIIKKQPNLRWLKSVKVLIESERRD
jgi:hypothetical protein